MRKSVLAAVAVCATLSACAALKQTRTGTVDSAYMNALNARLAQENQNAVSLDAVWTKHLAAWRASALKVDNTAEFVSVSHALFNAGVMHARAMMLSRFLRETAASGQIGLMTAWLQNRTTELQSYSSNTDIEAKQLQSDASKNPKAPDLGRRYTNIMFERSLEQGAAEELLALANDVQGYARDYGNASAADQQEAARRFAELQAYLSAPRVMVEAPPRPVLPMVQPPSFTHCMQMGMFTNCVTN